MRVARQEHWGWGAALLAGLLLRGLLVWLHPRFVGDTLVYGMLARNMLLHHRYALTEEGHLRSTLIRLPGYPLFLAMCFAVFGVGHYLPVIWVQVGVDLLGCWLLGRLAQRVFGPRVGLACVWLAALCPFTANYASAALTETLSIFCVALGFWGLVRWMEDPRLRWAVAVGCAGCGAVLLRPDGVLLAGVLLPAMGWVAWRGAGAWSSGKRKHAGLLGVGVAAGLIAVCLGGWALRNWRVYHVVQPLAPKYANDPGEPAPLGFARWYRTWGVGLGDTARVYWEYDGSLLRMGDLPPWAFDSAGQGGETAGVIARYNAESASTPQGEAEFARLAAERVRAHPVRFYVGMPLARLGDMWLRPRTELFPGHMPLDWWKVRVRPRAALFAWVYGGLNLLLLGCALLGLVRWWRAGWGGAPVLAAAMLSFVLLRSVLLMTIDNSEPRYVLECYPVVLILAASVVGGWRRRRCTDATTRTA